MSRVLDLHCTPVFEKNWAAFHDPNIRYIVNQGGSRSSKTISIAQIFILLLMTERNEILTIARKTFPSLRQTVMRDVFDLMREYELYDEEAHDMTHHIYLLNRNIMEFISMDQPQKKRGAKRKHLWLNEANEFTYEDWMQLNLRTTGKVFLDFNPSDTEHFVYDKIIPREDAVFIQSTYRDNPFLERSLVQEIERLQHEDETYWKVFGLGEKATPTSLIFTNHTQCRSMPEHPDLEVFGLDFGFSNPTALVRVAVKDGFVFVDEVLYQTQMTNADVLDVLRRVVPNRKTFIYADHAEPQRIEEIYRAGYNIHPANKAVVAGIDFVKRFKLHITASSVNLSREIKQYKWKEDKNGHLLDEPVKFLDHALDAVRYAMFTHGAKYGQRIFGAEGAFRPKRSTGLRASSVIGGNGTAGRRRRSSSSGSDSFAGF